MSRFFLGKTLIASVLIATLYVPLSASAASSISFDFSTTILEATNLSPLQAGNGVSGHVQIDISDHWFDDTETAPIFGVPLTFPVSAFYVSSDTWGQASGPGWHQEYPGAVIGLSLINDYTLPTGAMSDALPNVSSMFPNLPSDGDIIDMLLISVFSNDFETAALEESFNIGLIYDAADGVVTGTGLADVDETQLFSSLIYGEFFAYADISNTDITVWEATGPIGASPVPIPAAIWLFGSGLLGIIGLARKHIN